MTHVVELSEEAFLNLQRVAEQEGVTPAEWITAAVSQEDTLAALAPFIGVVDSREHTPHSGYRSAFGDILDKKFARQGINPPRYGHSESSLETRPHQAPQTLPSNFPKPGTE